MQFLTKIFVIVAMKAFTIIDTTSAQVASTISPEAIDFIRKYFCINILNVIT